MNPYQKKAQEIQHYLDALFAPDDPVMQSVKKRMLDNQLPPISITPLVGKLLALLSRLVGAKRILEIGTLGGFSTIWLARALPPEGKLITIELDNKNAEIARKNIKDAGQHEKVEILIGKGLDHIRVMAQEAPSTFDLIFLDADKPSYTHYIEPMITLCRPGGLIIADNLIRRGKVIHPPQNDAQANNLAEFNRIIASHPCLESVLIPTLTGSIGGDIDGLSISRVLPMEKH
jgi:predicted O-methyltransferase YrrM